MEVKTAFRRLLQAPLRRAAVAYARVLDHEDWSARRVSAYMGERAAMYLGGVALGMSLLAGGAYAVLNGHARDEPGEVRKGLTFMFAMGAVAFATRYSAGRAALAGNTYVLLARDGNRKPAAEFLQRQISFFESPRGP